MVNKYLIFYFIYYIFFNFFGCSSSKSGTTNIIENSQRSLAVVNTVNQNSNCTTLPTDFYYEIGDQSGPLVTGTTGGSAIGAATNVLLASGSKWYFGAYVLEFRNQNALSKSDLQALQMQTGLISFSNCGANQTVSNCYSTNPNNVVSNSAMTRFYYGGGHFQFWGDQNGLGSLNNSSLAQEYKNVLGSELSLQFSSPQLAGGQIGSANDYAVFLRKILKNELKIYYRLGESAVCTQNCGYPTSSPVPEAWHYSYGHWVEDDPSTGDSAFSSPGLFGFYPWIDRDKKYYGILSRFDFSNSANPVSTSSYWRSVLCGRELRKAWLTGTVQ